MSRAPCQIGYRLNSCGLCAFSDRVLSDLADQIPVAFIKQA